MVHEYKNLLVSTNDHVLTITVNRPDKMNALNFETIREIGMAIRQGVEDVNINAIIITGSGAKSFIAGADISEFSNYSIEEAKALSSHGHGVFNSIENCPKPVIAAVNGFALGGGCEVAMACHLRVASVNARFGQPEVKLGLIPGYGGTQRLPQLIGKSKAMELLMTGDMIDAHEAYRLGLINKVVEPDQLMSSCIEMAERISVQAPLAITAIIETVNTFYENKNGFDYEIKRFADCFNTEDFKEGTDAFLNKRKPVFKGS